MALKRPINAFAYFLKENARVDENNNFIDLKGMAARYRSLPPADQQRLVDLSAQDSLEYKRQKELMEDAKIKRPLSAYLLFYCKFHQENRGKGYSTQKIGKDAGEVWRALSDHEKAKWEELADKGKDEYKNRVTKRKRDSQEVDSDDESSSNRSNEGPDDSSAEISTRRGKKIKANTPVKKTDGRTTSAKKAKSATDVAKKDSVSKLAAKKIKARSSSKKTDGRAATKKAKSASGVVKKEGTRKRAASKVESKKIKANSTNKKTEGRTASTKKAKSATGVAKKKSVSKRAPLKLKSADKIRKASK